MTDEEHRPSTFTVSALLTIAMLENQNGGSFSSFMDGAHTVLTLAARHPEIVDWVREELQEFWADHVVPYARSQGEAQRPVEIMEREFYDDIDKLAALIKAEMLRSG